MRKTLLFVCLAFTLQLATAQKEIAEKFASTISIDLLKKHLTIIASDEMEGRETGTIGQRRAAAYIESQFISILTLV